MDSITRGAHIATQMHKRTIVQYVGGKDGGKDKVASNRKRSERPWERERESLPFLLAGFDQLLIDCGTDPRVTQLPVSVKAYRKEEACVCACVYVCVSIPHGTIESVDLCVCRGSV
jgi:hypothetical protein